MPPGRARELFASAEPALSSNRLFRPLAGSNAYRFLDGGDEDLPVADAPRLRALLDGVDDLLVLAVRHDDLDLHLRHEVDDVCRAPVDLFLATRTSEAL